MTIRPARTGAAVAACTLAALLTWPPFRTGADEHAPIRYRLTFDEAAQRAMEVAIDVPGLDGPLELRMSRSSPGRYALHEFARNLVDLSVTDASGRALPVTQTAPHAWRAEGHGGHARVRYRVFGDRVDGTCLAVDTTHAHVNAPAALAWVRGLEDRPLTVTLVPPPDSGWQVATQLFPTADPFTFTAPSLSYLLDSPVEASRHVLRTFTADLPPGATGAAPRIALALHHTGTDADADAFVEDLRAIVRQAASVFGEYPAFEDNRYTFIADYLPWAVGDGMEHRNSTVVTSSSTLADTRAMLAGTAAHEFFHAWNVERIRPRSLEPFDFESWNMSGELWLAEGVTSYYEELLLARAGLASLDQALASFSSAVSAVLTSPATTLRSPAEMSRFALFADGTALQRTTFGDTYLSYYTVGHAVGLGLDLSIRRHTREARSLDDVFRALWARHGRPGGMPVGTVARPYTHEDVRDAIASVTDAAFASGFVARHVEGRDPLDYGALVRHAGLELRVRAPGRASLGLVAFERAGNRLLLEGPPAPRTPLHEAGLSPGDTLAAIGGRRIGGFEDVVDALAARRPGDRVPVRFTRRGESTQRTATVTLIEHPEVELVTLEAAGGSPTPEQLAVRKAWVGKR